MSIRHLGAVLLIVSCCLFGSSRSESFVPPLYKYKCIASSGNCVRQSVSEATANGTTLSSSSLEPGMLPYFAYHANGLHLCAMMCGQYRTLWPQPRGVVRLGNRFVAFDMERLSFTPLNPAWPPATHHYLNATAAIFRANIKRLAVACDACILPTDPASQTAQVTIRFDLRSPAVLHLNYTTDESYTLDVHTSADDSRTPSAMGNLILGAAVRVQINATTVFGLRNGLETLGQLLAQSVSTDGARSTTVILNSAKITDSPAYAHRGLLIDTARNPLQPADMRRTIEAMAATKLNVLHWHATDTQSFSLDLGGLPQMAATGGYSRRSLFSAADVRELVEFGRQRGVRVLLELDAPAHVGNGWQWGAEAGLGNLTVCANAQPWRKFCIQPPCGQLNPANQMVYTVLHKVYEALKAMLPAEERMLHMGGDEVFFGCWNATAEVVDWMAARGMGRRAEDFLQVWSEFQELALRSWTTVVGESTEGAAEPPPKTILWSSQLTAPATIERYLSRDRYIIQTWVPSSDPVPAQLLERGYQLIVSTKNAWYFDHGFWGQTAYYTWQRAYDNRLPAHRGVLGGEACVWSELIDGQTLDGRTWPRAAAVAERLWTNGATGAWSAITRMYRMRDRLVRGGVQAEAVAPRWCVQNEGECL